MNKQRIFALAVLAASSSTTFAGGTVRQAPPEAEAAPMPALAPLVTPTPAPIYQLTNYIGIGIGASRFRGGCVTSNSDTGYKIFAGHNLTPNIGVELSYVDLGRSTDDLTCIASRAGTGSTSGSGGTSGGGTSGGGTSGGGTSGGGTGGSGTGGGGTGSSGTGGSGTGGSGTDGGTGGGTGIGIGIGTGGSVTTGTGSSGSGSSTTGNGSTIISSGSGSGTGSAISTSSDPHIRGVGLALVAGMPFYNNAASIYIKGGTFFYHATDDVNGGNSNNGTSPFYGIGAQYNLGIHHGVRAEYERYHNVGTDATGKQNVDLASISYVYRF